MTTTVDPPSGTSKLPLKNDNNTIQTEVARISVKIPPFWCADPALWFCQLESQFETSGITADKTKYHSVVAAIESNILSQVSDIVLNPPTVDLYKTLKSRLLERFRDSEESRLKKLLLDIDLGDRRPSQLLYEMKALAVDNINPDVIKTLWLQRLPSQIQAILSISGETLDRLATMADRIAETITPNILSIERGVTTNTNFSTLSYKIEQLTRRFDRMSPKPTVSNVRRRSESRSKSFLRSSSKSPSRSSNVCWYHTKFATKATKCRPPCNFKSSSDSTLIQEN